MEGNLEMLEEDWENILKSQWKTTHSSTWREFGWKNVTRLFLTPEQKRYQGKNAICWRMCGSNIFWECSKVQKYWQEIRV